MFLSTHQQINEINDSLYNICLTNDVTSEKWHLDTTKKH